MRARYTITSRTREIKEAQQDELLCAIKIGQVKEETQITAQASRFTINDEVK